MKKLVSILILLIIMLGVSVAESVLSTRYYTKMQKQLTQIDVMLLRENPQEDGDVLKSLMDELVNEWNGKQKYVMAFSNHAIIRTLDEKLVCIKAWIDNEKYDNAHEFCVTAIELSRDIIDDTHLTLANLL